MFKFSCFSLHFLNSSKRKAVVHQCGAVQKQYILIPKRKKISQELRGQVTGIHHGNFFVAFHKKGGQTASEGIPEQNQLLLCICVRAFDDDKRLAAGQEQLIGIPAFGFF